MYKKIGVILLITVMMLVLFNQDTARQGMIDGIQICLNNLVPSLFPLFFIIGYLSEFVTGFRSKILCRFFASCGIESGTESVFILSLISGYPVGATMIHDLTLTKAIDRNTAYRLMAFCNNAGPAFIFGLTLSLFHEKWLAWVVWGTQIISSVLVALIFPKFQSIAPSKIEKRKARTLSQIMLGSIKSIAQVCGWVVIFRVVLALIKVRVNNFSSIIPSVIIRGILELTNGSISLNEISSEAIRFVLFNIFLSFGGLCVWMQIISSAGELITQAFFLGKILHTLFCAMLSLILQYMLFTECIRGAAVWIVTLFCFTGIGTICYYVHSKITVAKRKNMMYNARKTIRNEA